MTSDIAASAPRLKTLAREWLDTLVTFAAFLAVMLVVRILVFQPHTIPSSSMEPELETGDYIVSTVFDYGWSGAALPLGWGQLRGRLFERTAKRGDVVLFRLPRDESQTYIKRVVGLPGDRVRVSDGRVFVNGVENATRPIGPAVDRDAPHRVVTAVEETAAGGETYVTFEAGPGHPGDDTRTFVVPAGHYFMMGDNRDNSLDSRWPREVGVGFVPAENLIGKGRIVLASWKPGASLLKPWTWARLKWDRFLEPVG